VLLFDLFDGLRQSLLLVWVHVGDVAFGVGVKQVDDTWLRDEQINDSGSTAFAFAFGAPADFSEASQTGDHASRFRIGREIGLEEPIFLVRKQGFDLLGKRGMFDKSEHKITLTLYGLFIKHYFGLLRFFLGHLGFQLIEGQKGQPKFS